MVRSAACALAVALLLAVPLPAPAGPPEAPAPTVAVLYFDYDGKDEGLGLLRKGLAQMLISDLAGAGPWQLVERERLEALLAELKLNRTTQIAADGASRMGRLLGARFLVLGAYFEVAGTLRVDARVVEVETGRVVRSVGTAGKPDDFLAVEQKLVADLKEVLAGKLPPRAPDATRPPPAAPKPPARLPASTATRYSRALDARDRGDRETARAQLALVLKEQPDFTLAAMDLDRMVK